ncbi:MAG TPA: LLM class flavin-dependent oxidoreductase [Pseudonocardiaceae bacterium]
MRPFEFGVQLYGATDVKEWREQAQRAYDLGYRSVHLPDHLGGQFDPLLGLADAAAAVPGLRIGTLVLNCATRHPVVLAKALATLDVLTDGRLEVGLGAGWQRTDFERTGIDRLGPAGRVRRLTEYVTILETLWRGEELTHHGEFFDIDGARCLPTPVQRSLPLLIGGGSADILRFAGRRARAVALDVPQPAGRFEPTAYLSAAHLSAFRQRADWAREAGRDIELLIQIPSGLIGPADAATEIAAHWGVSVDALQDTPLALVGDVDEVADRLRRWRAESDVSRIVVPADAMTTAQPLVARLTGT